MDYKYQVLQKEVQVLRKDKERQDSLVDDLQTQLSKIQDEIDDTKALNNQLEEEKRELRAEFEKYFFLLIYNF
jgi:peptidoglycan hydrolase CwlO-like protein